MNPCQQTESRIHQLLDQRQPWETDSQLAAHLQSCDACRQLVASYDALLTGCHAAQLSAGQATPAVSPNFAEGVVRAAAQGQVVASSSRLPNRVLGGLAVAAVLLIAAWPFIRQYNADLQQPRQTQFSSIVDRTGVLSFQLDEESNVWQVTGRNLATLPVTVRQATQWPGEERLADSIRPMASSVGATVEALIRILPNTDEVPWDDPAQLPNGDTGHYRPASPLTMV